jgi:hypothetical protein
VELRAIQARSKVRANVFVGMPSAVPDKPQAGLMKSRLKKYLRAIILSLSLGLMPAVSLGAQDPWQFLDNFTPVPSSLTRISERYVAMIFVNRDEQLSAAVIFAANCSATDCELNYRAGYAVVNPEGSHTRIYVNPDDEELKELLTSISVRYPAKF